MIPGTSMAIEPWDVIIVGQGLAGTTLAWHLRDAGQRVLVIDADEQVTASKIAAGLITPITGLRMALSWRGDVFLSAARAFYTRVETLTGTKFFHDGTAVRLFVSDAERQNWAQRCVQPAVQTHLVMPPSEPLLDPKLGDASCGGFEMYAARLDVAAYLEASRAVFETEFLTLDWQHEVTIEKDGVSVGGRRARYLVSCEGYGATRNPYFSWVPFKAAKGDILTVRFHSAVPDRCIHRGIWIAPTAGPDVFRVGSTYDWDTLDQVPSAPARAEIEGKLQEFFHVPYTVLNHQAAVRPVIRESKALIGLHPAHDRLGYFNGLGSKGSLHAPWFAHAFTRFLVEGTPLPEGSDLRKAY